MATDTNNLVLHIRRLVYSTIRFGYQSACDYPLVFGASILLVVLHKLCPSVFAFLMSSSPVFLLAALLLGALLSYGQPTVSLVGKDTLQNQQSLSLKSKISITKSSIDEVRNVVVKAHLQKRSENVGQRASDDRMQDTLYEEKDGRCMAADIVVSEKGQVAERIADDNMVHPHRGDKNITFMADTTVISLESYDYAKSNVIVERDEHVKEINEMEESEGRNTENDNYKVHNQYQMGEIMSSCWQPVIRQDLPCYNSDSDLAESSSPDASMTDIIPMLEELHPMIDLGTGYPSLASQHNLISSSDDSEDDLEVEEDSVSTYEEEDKGQKGNGNNWKDVADINYLNMENNIKLANLMELQKAKNILKFELDRRQINMQTDDAIQKWKEASSFRVQVPSISTPRPRFGYSNNSDETIDLPQIPDSAPSVLLPGRSMFDLPFDQIVDHGSRWQETWTPRSHLRATEQRKHRNSYRQQSTHMQYDNGEISGKDACHNHSDDAAEQERENGKLFGSLEAHLGEEIKILSAAISDVGVLEVNCGMYEGNKNATTSDDTNLFSIMESTSSTSEAQDSVHAGCEQSISAVSYSEPHIEEADSISEVNSLFRCRMEKVLAQSVSERSIGQPLTVKLEDESSGPLSRVHVTEACSVEGLNLRYARRNEEAPIRAVSDSTFHIKSAEDKSSEVLHVVNDQNSELPTENGSRMMLTAQDHKAAHNSVPNGSLTTNAELYVIEAASVEEMNSQFELLQEEAHAQMPSSENKQNSDMLSVEAKSTEDISSDFRPLSNGRSIKNMPQDCELAVGLVELNFALPVMDAKTLDDIISNSDLRLPEPKSSAEHTESTGVEGQSSEHI